MENETIAGGVTWLDVADVARRYKTSVRHIFRLADRGGMPWGIKLGHLRRWSMRDLELWEKTGCCAVGRVGPARDGGK